MRLAELARIFWHQTAVALEHDHHRSVTLARMAVPIVALYGSLNAFFNVFLANQVSTARRKNKVSLGHGESDELLRASRALPARREPLRPARRVSRTRRPSRADTLRWRECRR